MNSSKTNQFITKLIRLTNEDKIHWEINEPPAIITRGTNDVVPIFFKARFRDEKIIAIYERRYQVRSFFREPSGIPPWDREIVLAILDKQNHVLWKNSESSTALHDLMDTVREKAAGIDELINEFLDEPGNH